MRKVNLPLNHTGFVEYGEEHMTVYTEDGEVALTVAAGVPDNIVADIIWIKKRAFDKGMEAGQAMMPGKPAKVDPGLANAPLGYIGDAALSWENGWNACRDAILAVEPGQR